MRTAITSWSFPALDLSAAARVASAIGIDRMDIGLLHGPALDRAAVLADPDTEGERIRATLSGAGVAAANLYWLFGDGLRDRTLSDRESHAENLADFPAVCRFGARAGCDTLFVLPGVALRGLTPGAALDASASALRAMVPIARDHGLTLTVEPHVHGLLASPAATLALLDAVPGLGLTLDYAHFVCLGYSQEAIDALAPHARHVHMRQARPGFLQAKWDEGTIDFAAVIETLRENGYAGDLSIEYVHQAFMNTIMDDVLTETVAMRDLIDAHVTGR